MNDIINIDGKEIKQDQIYHGFCCAGHDWRVALVFEHSESVWGVCDNPDCPDYLEELGPDNDMYRGVSSWEPREFLEMVESGNSRFPERLCPICEDCALDHNDYCWNCSLEAVRE